MVAKGDDPSLLGARGLFSRNLSVLYHTQGYPVGVENTSSETCRVYDPFGGIQCMARFGLFSHYFSCLPPFLDN